MRDEKKEELQEEKRSSDKDRAAGVTLEDTITENFLKMDGWA
jgi:hypothetical protein